MYVCFQLIEKNIMSIVMPINRLWSKQFFSALYTISLPFLANTNNKNFEETLNFQSKNVEKTYIAFALLES